MEQEKSSSELNLKFFTGNKGYFLASWTSLPTGIILDQRTVIYNQENENEDSSYC